MKNIFSKYACTLSTAVIILLLSAATGCAFTDAFTDRDKSSSTKNSSGSLALTLRTNPVPFDTHEQFLSFNADGKWVLSTSDEWLLLENLGETVPEEDEDASDEEASTDPVTITGKGSQPIILLSLANTSEEERSGKITLKSGGKTAVLQVNQRAFSSPAPEDEGKSTVTAGWLELPETFADDGLDAYTVRFTDEGRSYTFYWDYDTFVSNWVAYPLNQGLIGAHIKRTDAWGLCPLLPASRQSNVSTAYHDANDVYAGYDRGHQLPSADRLGTYARNAQTFYGVNITPQNSNLNQNIWASLEGQVRTWAQKTYTDTLYVVTGCVTKGATEVVYDAVGHPVTVPTAYFKALLLREKTGSSVYSSTGGYASTAFWFDHVEYSQSGKYNASLNKSLSISVAELEEKLGYSLFVNLGSLVGDEMATTIKAANNIQW